MDNTESNVNLGFWKNYTKKALGRPCFVLAPMADVTDCAFRKIIAKLGKPDVMWTEFVSADGIVRATPEGKAKLMRDLIYHVHDTETGETIYNERPIVAQLFSSHPEYMKQAAKLVAELGFDGIDINMGCPDKSIEKQCAGAAMMKNPRLAQEVIFAAKEGGVRKAQAKFNDDPELVKIGSDVHLPVSVKTRIGYNKNELDTWLIALLETKPAVITIHARTRKEMSKVPARFEHIKQAVLLRDEFFEKLKNNTDSDSGKDKVTPKTLIFGNGDILGIADGYAKAIETGADGVMLGRAIFGNPWLFKDINKTVKGILETGQSEAYLPSTEEKLLAIVEHTKEFEKNLGDIKSFAIMKKHYKAYVNGFDESKELRAELMEKANSASEVEKIVKAFINKSQ